MWSGLQVRRLVSYSSQEKRHSTPHRVTRGSARLGQEVEGVKQRQKQSLYCSLLFEFYFTFLRRCHCEGQHGWQSPFLLPPEVGATTLNLL
jgi:hypothetical protein